MKFRSAYDLLRCPKGSPKCYEMTEQERLDAIVRLNRNVWNDPQLAKLDRKEKTDARDNL